MSITCLANSSGLDNCAVGLPGGVSGQPDLEGAAWTALLCFVTLDVAGIVDLCVFKSDLVFKIESMNE